MSLLITMNPADTERATSLVGKALKASLNGDYLATQVVNAMPAALDLVAVAKDALIDWRVALDGKRRDYALSYGNDLPGWAKLDLQDRMQRIAKAEFALAKAGVVDFVRSEAE